jgi:hypothetical protein
MSQVATKAAVSRSQPSQQPEPRTPPIAACVNQGRGTISTT